MKNVIEEILEQALAGIPQERPPLVLAARVQAAVRDTAGECQLPLTTRIIRARQGQQIAPMKSVQQEVFQAAIALKILEQKVLQYIHLH
jgi:hypothetical protein